MREFLVCLKRIPYNRTRAVRGEKERMSCHTPAVLLVSLKTYSGRSDCCIPIDFPSNLVYCGVPVLRVDLILLLILHEFERLLK